MRRAFGALALGVCLIACDAKHKGALPVPGPPRRGGVLRVSATALTSLDPMLARSPSEVQAAAAIFTPLTTWDPVTLTSRPGVAASWSATPDQRTWTFKIRSGAVFSDGNPITAKDVIFTYSRIAQNPASPSVTLFADVASVAAGTADGDVQVSLSTPVSVLPDILANPALGIVEQAAPPTGAAPVGSGPFTVSDRTPAVLKLVRAPGAATYVDGIEMVTFSDVVAAYAAFRSGAIDWSTVPPASAAEAALTFHQRVSRPLDAELFYGINLRSPLVSDVRYRQALRRAVDWHAIVNGPYRGTVLPLAGVVTASGDAPCGSSCSYDPARTRASLFTLFGPTGPPALSIDYDDDPTQAAVVGVLADGFQAVGVFSRLQPHPPAAYQPGAPGAQAELFRGGWVAQYPGPDGVLAPLFLSGRIANLTGIASPEVDAAINAARAEADPGRRAVAYRAAEAKVLALAPVVPLVQFESHTVTAPRVQGLLVNAMGLWDPASVWLTR